MPGNRRLIRQLAQSRKIGHACVAVGEDIKSRALQIDPDADIKVTQTQMVVNGLRRVAARVENVSPDAAELEFGHAAKTGTRPLGRASGEHRG